jgi:hypothetical protein
MIRELCETGVDLADDIEDAKIALILVGTKDQAVVEQVRAALLHPTAAVVGLEWVEQAISQRGVPVHSVTKVRLKMTLSLLLSDIAIKLYVSIMRASFYMAAADSSLRVHWQQLVFMRPSPAKHLTKLQLLRESAKSVSANNQI